MVLVMTVWAVGSIAELLGEPVDLVRENVGETLRGR